MNVSFHYERTTSKFHFSRKGEWPLNLKTQEDVKDNNYYYYLTVYCAVNNVKSIKTIIF